MDAEPTPASNTAEATVSAERAFLSDVRLVLAFLNWVRYPVLKSMFGLSRDQVNLVTFVLALSAAERTYDAVRRFVRHPWPLDGADTLLAAGAVRELELGVAGPKARAVQLSGTLLTVAAVSGLLLPGMRRAFHGVHVVEQRVGRQRMRIYGAAEQERLSAAAHE